MRCSSLACLVAALLPCLTDAQIVLNLGDVDWTLSNGNNVTIPGRFPSQAHLDLYDAGIIDEPLYGFNDYQYLWVKNGNWTWTSKPISSLNKGAERTWFVFEGLDTFVEIKLCGETIANVANQYRQFIFDVTEIVDRCSQDAVISLNFGPASTIITELAKSGPDYINEVNAGFVPEWTNKVYMRKEQNDIGWDWSPSFAPAGPWKPGFIVQRTKGSREVYVNNALIDIYRQGQRNNLPPQQNQPWIFNASIDFLGHLPPRAELHLALRDSAGRIVKETPLQSVSCSTRTITGHAVIHEHVDLWWPHSMGEQPLYTATISIEATDNGSKLVKLATIERRVGFRTIVLNLDPVSETATASGVAPGANWHFEINGQEFYAKGSNLVPPDVFWARVTTDKMRQLLTMAIEGRQNMLRVWASGAYLPDEFYALADEMGILLWSEFQFSDGQYPATPSFLEQYEAEAYYNVRRVNHHPSLALWAGNNELEGMLLLYYYEKEQVVQGYQKVFEELLIKCVYANTRSISYIPSSTYNGFQQLDFGSVRPQTPRYLNKSSPDALYANTDYYNYDAAQAFNLSVYPLGRFANEFGFFSMPSIETWREAIPEDQLYFESPGVLHRNRHYPHPPYEEVSSADGVAQLTDAVKMWYPTPSLSNMAANFSSWTWSTQVFQADMYVSQVAFYRRGSALRERQLGSLYWQLNDVWVGPTWSSIDATGRPKIVYYAMKDLFSPIIIRPYYDQNDDSLEVWVISDEWTPVHGRVQLDWTDWTGKELGISHHSSVSVGPINGTRIIRYDGVTKLLGSDRKRSDSVLSLFVTTGEHTHKSYFSAAALVNANLADPGLELRVGKKGRDADTGTVSFTVTARKAVAAWVWLDWPSTVKGHFDDNGFWLSRGESRTVYFRILGNSHVDDSWVKDVTVRSMWDNTQHT